TIPTSKSQVFSTAADNQTSVDIHVLQGEREMAGDNKTLGRFSLTGIAPAPRGIPKIEVKFDIDANGIVHVTAKDLGTQKEQSVTITSSTNLSDADIDKAVKDAEKYAEEDKKRKAAVEARNGLDQMILSLEQFIRESGDKLDPADKTHIQEDIEKGKQVLAKSDATTDELKAETDRIAQSSAAIFQKFYEQAQQQSGGATGGADGDVKYDVSDDDKK
ncbi:MAG: Hsp70 family protein, partial [Clostridia bacterium]|nr:Hsp70 family protein [Clostridia bacterium]